MLIFFWRTPRLRINSFGAGKLLTRELFFAAFFGLRVLIVGAAREPPLRRAQDAKNAKKDRKRETYYEGVGYRSLEVDRS